MFDSFELSQEHDMQKLLDSMESCFYEGELVDIYLTPLLPNNDPIHIQDEAECWRPSFRILGKSMTNNTMEDLFEKDNIDDAEVYHLGLSLNSHIVDDDDGLAIYGYEMHIQQGFSQAEEILFSDGFLEDTVVFNKIGLDSSLEAFSEDDRLAVSRKQEEFYGYPPVTSNRLQQYQNQHEIFSQYWPSFCCILKPFLAYSLKLERSSTQLTSISRSSSIIESLKTKAANEIANDLDDALYVYPIKSSASLNVFPKIAKQQRIKTRKTISKGVTRLPTLQKSPDFSIFGKSLSKKRDTSKVRNSTKSFPSLFR